MSHLRNMIGKEVLIYPGDTYYKKGIIEQITNFGVLFTITEASKQSSDYVVGKKHFIPFSAKLSFREI